MNSLCKHFATTPLDLILILAADGHIINGSPAWTAIMGYAVPDLVGRQFSELIHPDDVHRVDLDNSEAFGASYLKIRCIDHRKHYHTIEWSISSSKDQVCAIGREVTEHALMTASLLENEQRLQAIVNTSFDAIITINTGGYILSFNPAAERLFGYRASDVIGKKVNILMPDPYRAEHDTYLRRYYETNDPHVIGKGREVTAKHRNGNVFPVDLAIAETVQNGERIFIGYIRDISELKGYQEQLREMAFRDDVTDLYNRRLFEHDLELAFANSQRTHNPIYVIFLDINDFKDVNDTFGHAVGDEVLRIVATRLRKAFREGDIVARLGGDEFVILVTDSDQLSMLKRLKARLDMPLKTSAQSFSLRFGVGYSIFPDHKATSHGELLRQADAAMYVSKRMGKKRSETIIVCYRPDLEDDRDVQTVP